MKKTIKITLNIFCLVLVSPFAFTVWIEQFLFKDQERVFSLWTHVFAVLPGLPGTFLRRAFYHLVLDHCSLNCNIGFGSVFTHRQVIIEDNVSIGLYAIIGSACIGKNCEIASRVSITSGKYQHTKDNNGNWTACDRSKMRQTCIAPNVWIGEGAIIMADVGEGSLIGAGAVVTKEIPSSVVAVGNPAKILRKLEARS